MNKINVILGCSYGDEGKGQIVHDLCQSFQESNLLVVRFSGGHQVGHTVHYKDFQHTFSNFGSGTLLNIPTYWSHFCTIYPNTWWNERCHLCKLGYNPKLIINPECLITTPFDVWMNQQEAKLNSVGLGFYRTLKRNEDHYVLKVMDLFNEYILRSKLIQIAKYYLKLTKSNEDFLVLFWEELKIEEFIKNCNKLIQYTEIKELNLSEYNCICEGSQGILLDKEIGIYPYVTPSKTNDYNLQFLFKDYNPAYFFVSRSYLTRHGSGPIYHEINCNRSIINPIETNFTNQYQGALRTGYLKSEMVQFSLNQIIKSKANKKLILTCCDVLENPKYISNETIQGGFLKINNVNIIKKFGVQHADIKFT